MVNLQIPEELDTVLQSAAERAGLSKEELAQDILAAHFEDEFLPLTDQQIAHLQGSLAQLDRGEVVDGDVVMAKLNAVVEKQKARLLATA